MTTLAPLLTILTGAGLIAWAVLTLVGCGAALMSGMVRRLIVILERREEP